MSLRAAAIALACALVAAPMAWAHPHVFVDAEVGVRFGAHGLEAVRLTWRFDDLHSIALLQRFDREEPGGFTPAAVREMERQHVRGLEPLQFFLDVQVNGVPVAVTEAREFVARVDRGQVVYLFTAPVSPPASAEGVVRIDVADPGYYIAFALAERVQVEATGPYRVECRLARDPETKRPDGVRCVYGPVAR